MEIVELDCNGEWYKKGYRVGIRCNRWEQLEGVTDLYDFWMHQTYCHRQFDVHFTMDNKSNCWLCFKTMEELFLAKMTFGFSIEN